MNGVSGGGGAVGKRRGWNLAKTKKMMVGLATTEHEFSVVAPPPPPPRQSRPPPPSMTRMPFPDDDDPIWGSTYWPDDDDHDNDDVNAVEKAKQVIGRGAKFASVIEACAVVPKFWLHLKSIKYVSMMTCVCKHTRRIMDPDEHHHHLPFWGVWTLFMPPQPLKNIDKMMHVTRGDLKHLKHAAEKIFPDRVNSPKEYSLSLVWDYMLEKNGGVKGYAKDIKKYRKGRETHRKRQISFAKKNVEMEDKMVRAPPPALEQPCSSTAEEEDAIFTPKAAKKQKRTSREEEEERDANELRDEFSRALCGSHGCFTPMSFVEDPDNAAEEESMCLGKRWKMFVECKELCDLFFSPFHDKSDTAFSIHHHSTAQMWAMAITNFAMKRHMTKIMDLVNKRSPLKLDAKRMLVVEETRDLCTVMSMWWRGMDSRAEHVVSLWNLFSTVGDVRRDAKIMYAVVSADDMYHASMEVLTRKVIRNGGGGGGGSNVEAEFIRALDNEEGGYLGCVVKLRNTLRGVLHTDS